MNPSAIQDLLLSVSRGKTSVDSAMKQLRHFPFEKTEHAMIDHHRALRCGHPEVIFCQGKTVEQVIAIARRMSVTGQRVLATRASKEQLAAIRKKFKKVEISDLGRVALINPEPTPQCDESKPYVAVVCAGTADLPVVEEAAMTLRSMNVPTQRLTDVGVAGLHRLLAHTSVLQNACAIVVAAGMEGALPSVVGGLVACPVYAVPTSIGYGASMNGLAALLAMLNSCASNVSVVNIDNGFGAAFSASLLYRQVVQHARTKKGVAARD